MGADVASGTASVAGASAPVRSTAAAFFSCTCAPTAERPCRMLLVSTVPPIRNTNTAAALRIYRHWRRPSFRERVFACCASARTCAVQRAWKFSGISGASWAIAASSLSS